MSSCIWWIGADVSERLYFRKSVVLGMDWVQYRRTFILADIFHGSAKSLEVNVEEIDVP